MSNLGDRLIQLKTEKKLLQQDIARDNGISLRTYRYYEKGEHFPPADILAKLATYFGVSTDYLLGRSSKRPAIHMQGINMKKTTQPLILELMNIEAREYLKKEYFVSIPCTDEEYSTCQAEFDKSWDSGERTYIEDFDELITSMNEDCEK